ncbi:hypothetical protein M436DRAFT_62646 [Aureobasidium namibiae CBS 147.97]|uniref:Uncharacterized protein n=1 Tax=Aureobasidium namibiae CBS 147.97 TaxID=1043004 RepID=A0A074WM66_9PEZI
MPLLSFSLIPRAGSPSTKQPFGAIGKTETVMDLLRHLPCLDGKGIGHMIAYETIPVDFTVDATALIGRIPEFPIMGHCVYITDGCGREGYRLIVDIEEGTTTAFSITGYEWLSESWEYHKDRPAIDEWRAHRTLPTTEFFAAWTQRYEKLVWFISPCPNYPGGGSFQTRANSWDEQEEILHQELTKRIPDCSEAEGIEDPNDRAEDFDNQVSSGK